MRKISLRLISTIAAVLALTATLGCGALAGGTLNGTTQQKTTAEISAVTIQALDVLTQAGHTAEAIRTFERAQFQKGVITSTQDAAFQLGFLKLQAAADAAIDQVVAKSLSVKDAATRILDQLSGLLIVGQDAIVALVDGLKSLLTALKNGTVPTPVPVVH